MSLKLYYVPQTRATRPRWLLEELGVPYELVRLDPQKGETRTPEYLALNPLGHVPTLVDDELVMTESAAILLYLADKFPEGKLAPAAGTPARAAYYQWILFCMSTLEPPLSLLHAQAKLPDAEKTPAVIATAQERVKTVVATVDKIIRTREHILGEGFSAADVLLASTVGWAKGYGLVESFPYALEYVRRCVARPAAKRARSD
jgi:glutathione S-transferase